MRSMDSITENVALQNIGILGCEKENSYFTASLFFEWIFAFVNGLSASFAQLSTPSPLVWDALDNGTTRRHEPRRAIAGVNTRDMNYE